MSPAIFLACGLAAIGLAIALLAMILLSARTRQDAVARALSAIETGYSRYVPRDHPAAAESFAALAGWLRRLAVALSPRGLGSTLQRRLDLAGNPPRWTADRILALKGLGLLGLALVAGLYELHHIVLAIVCVGLGGAAGFFLPDLLLYNTALKRQAKIQLALPDALDMLTVCVEAGLGFDAALAQVARNTTGPLAAEFARALQEMQIGNTRSEALRGMASRTTVPELRAFVSSLVQAGELGIAIAQVLREQAKEMRLRRRQRAEEKAQKVSVKILFPLIACLFPALFVIVIGPGAINIMHSLIGVGRLCPLRRSGHAPTWAG
jgi:tight adherence protein C